MRVAIDTVRRSSGTQGIARRCALRILRLGIGNHPRGARATSGRCEGELKRGTGLHQRTTHVRNARHRIRLRRCGTGSPAPSTWFSVARHHGITAVVRRGCRTCATFAEMAALGWVGAGTRVGKKAHELLKFFSIAKPEHWREVYEGPQAAFRRSPKVRGKAAPISAWLHRGERQATEVRADGYDADRFHALLPALRALTLKSEPKEFIPDPRQRARVMVLG